MAVVLSAVRYWQALVAAKIEEVRNHLHHNVCDTNLSVGDVFFVCRFDVEFIMTR